MVLLLQGTSILSYMLNVCSFNFFNNTRVSGAQRSRMLTNLYKDERCERLPSYSILKKMHLERIIKQEEVVLAHLLSLSYTVLLLVFY